MRVMCKPGSVGDLGGQPPRSTRPTGSAVLSQSFRVGKRHKGLYLRLVVDTGRGRLTAYLNGRVLKRWPYKLLND